MAWWVWSLVVVGVAIVLVAAYDLTQKSHAVLRNFPIIGHFRYWLEAFGPELRQYIVSDNDEERPFSRDQRRWVYATAKQENPYFGFGTDNRLDVDGYVFFRHSAFPISHGPPSKPDSHHADAELPALPSLPALRARKTLGEWRARSAAFVPESVVNISAMSYGSLSGPAVEALNRGSKIAGCMHNTGEGGISSHHRHGGDLIFQIGTGYFGARDQSSGRDGRFSMDAFLASIEAAPAVRAIEVKLSQGAKPGMGGVLPGAKVTKPISRARGVPVGVTVHSPNRHPEFSDMAGLVDFVERLADATDLPIGIKSAVGDRRFWRELADHMADSNRGPDFIAIDGGEGGTGAGPLTFTDHVALPFRAGFAEAFSAFAAAGSASTDLTERIVFVGAGKLGFAPEAMVAMAMGADLVAVAREAMMAIGCIQAQRCHTGHCPTGVATQGRWLTRGLDPTDKAARLANYVAGLRDELLTLSHAMGVDHPSLVDPQAVEMRTRNGGLAPVLDALGYPTAARQARLAASGSAAATS